ncbi:MAG: hypothetical protein IMY85_07280 [Chloroflexi bacterium]|nr:hypothetical protein [Chloroflexota bacterium]
MRPLKKYPALLILCVLGVILVLGLKTVSAYPQAAQNYYLPIVIERVFLNPSFEQEKVGWVFHSNQGDDVVTTAEAHTGIRSAGLGNGNKDRVASIVQKVTVPSDAYAVHYYQKVTSLEECPSDNVVKVFINNNIYQHYNICKDYSSPNWVERFIYLAPYKGQRVEFRLQFESSTSMGNHVYVDDFSFGLP